jgi:NRPS condensation-like uncharacterized protein
MKKNTTNDKPLRAQGTDLWGIAQAEYLYPLVFCHLELDGHIDIPRLKDAITQSCQIVPEVLCSFDVKKKRWIDRGLTADAVVLEDTHDLGNGWRWDLLSDTQLKISVCHHAKGDSLVFALSHILSDGTGLKQYLYLLADIYNSGTVLTQIKNNRDISLFIGGIHPKPLPMRIRISKADGAKHLPFDDRNDYASPEGEEYGSCLRERVSTDELAALKVHVKSLGCTVNDALLAAYARVAARILDTDFVVLPCPANLRQFFTEEPALTIANMTGSYVLPVTIGSDDGFDATLKQIHESLRLRKKYRRPFTKIRAVELVCRMLPSAIVYILIRKFNYILPISYTNMGIVDNQKLRFEGCAATDCFLTGSYRHSPDFHLSVSTFRDNLSLCATVLGSDRRRELCQDALKHIKKELVTRGQSMRSE